MISREQLKRLFPRASGDVLDRSAGVVSQASEPTPINRPGILCSMRASKDEDALNKTEKRYLIHLRSQAYDWIGIQNVTVKLSNDCRYTPDFCTVRDLRFVCHDVKAFRKSTGKPHVEDDALVKIKEAASKFPFFFFVLAWEENGQWITREINP